MWEPSCIACVSRVADHLAGEDVLPLDDINATVGQMRIQSEGAVFMAYSDEVSACAVTIFAPIVGVRNDALARSKN